MPLEYEIDSVTGVIYEQMLGDVTADDIFESVRRQEADPLWHEDLNGLTDLSLGTLKFTGDDVRRRADQHMHHMGPGCTRWALVAPSDVQYGMSRMMKTFAEAGHTEVRIFRQRPEAVEWVVHGTIPTS